MCATLYVSIYIYIFIFVHISFLVGWLVFVNEE